MLVQQLCRLFESVLRVLAVDAFVVELGGGRLDLGEHLQHVLSGELACTDQGQEKGSMRR